MIRIRCRKHPWCGDIDIAVFDEMSDGRKAILKNPTMEVMQDGESIAPSLVLSNEEAQLLMDELWMCGLRPSEGTGSAGSLRKTEDHLKDMRRIAFGLLGHIGVDGGKTEGGN